jgi:hypothetical protein
MGMKSYRKKRLEKLRGELEQEVGSSTMDTINEVVELELLIEADCNQ